MKSPASISFSISKVYNEKKPKYFLRASAKVNFKVFYLVREACKPGEDMGNSTRVNTIQNGS